MAKEHYTIIYSARDASGVMWCPDCRRVEATVSSLFKTDENNTEGPPAEIIYVERADWKSPSNKYRQEPWKVTGVPTVLKLNAKGTIVDRIEDADILDPDKVTKFLGEDAGLSD